MASVVIVGYRRCPPPRSGVTKLLNASTLLFELKTIYSVSQLRQQRQVGTCPRSSLIYPFVGQPLRRRGPKPIWCLVCVVYPHGFSPWLSLRANAARLNTETDRVVVPRCFYFNWKTHIAGTSFVRIVIFCCCPARFDSCSYDSIRDVPRP